MKLDRIMIAAPASGSGKTSVTAGLLNLLKRHGKNPASFKCGPDYIDPMFHRSVLGTPCRNLDTFFTGEKITRYLLEEGAKESGIAVLEGVMGYFDGLGFESSKAGSSDLAGMTDTPVILVIPARGMSRSILALIKGFLDFDPKKCIRGIILNRLNPMLYDRMKTMIENELPIKVVGYVPEMKDFVLQSRHLGLLSPDEIGSLKEGIESLTDIMEKTIDLEVLLSIAADAPELPYERDHAAYREAFTDALAKADYRPDPSEPVRIAVAKDA
ncbi:MAG: AAA family ATPase, partial [Eubacterium sp.]|nr:AAA family ATPase [Eubacterium sp.]